MRAYRKETERQRLLVRKAGITQQRLLFVINALPGFQPGKIKLGYFNHLPYFLQVDLRLQKFFRFDVR